MRRDRNWVLLNSMNQDKLWNNSTTKVIILIKIVLVRIHLGQPNKWYLTNLTVLWKMIRVFLRCLRNIKNKARYLKRKIFLRESNLNKLFSKTLTMKDQLMIRSPLKVVRGLLIFHSKMQILLTYLVLIQALLVNRVRRKRSS